MSSPARQSPSPIHHSPVLPEAPKESAVVRVSYPHQIPIFAIRILTKRIADNRPHYLYFIPHISLDYR